MEHRTESPLPPPRSTGSPTTTSVAGQSTRHPTIRPSPTSSPTRTTIRPSPTLSPTRTPIQLPTSEAPVSIPPTQYPTGQPSLAPVTASPVESTVTLPIAEETDCRKVAPCHLANDADSQSLSCRTFYAKRFWDAAPPQMVNDLQHHRDHRPINCWYETELLVYHKATDAIPYKNAVCEGSSPDTVVFWHQFKVGGTTVRSVLGGTRFPNYQSGQHVFSNRIKTLFPNGDPKHAGSNYLEYADVVKQQIHDSQVEHGDKTVSVTFVRSPVQRFISGVEQIERLNNPGWEVSPEARPCFEIPEPAVKLECIVDKLLETRIFFNVHVYPQSYLFDAWTKKGELDLSVMVLDLNDMDTLFRRFKGKTIKRDRQSNELNTKLHLNDSDLNPNLLRKICQLYEADLLMLKAMGKEDELCAKAMANENETV